MKTVTIDLNNKEKLILVEKPDNMYAITEMLMWYNAELLGEYTPRTGEIDFADKIQGDWVQSYFGERITKGCWNNYENKKMECKTKEESFLSLLKTETEKASPLKEMPHKFIVLKSL